MNSLVVQHHHQNIKICSQNFTLNKILDSVGVPGFTFIAALTKIYTTSISNPTHPPTCELLHRNFLPEKEGKKKLVPY